MAGITDNEADIVITGKIDSSNDLRAGRDVHSVVHVVAEAARLILGRVWVATLVGKEHLHHR